MVDLTAMPFHLDADAVAWVRETIASLTLEEKVGQLFINLNVSFNERYLDNVLDRYHVGGMRYRGDDSAAIQEHIRYVQSRSKVPLLIASNPEMGGFGSSDDGTLVGTHLQAGSNPDPTIAYRMGQVAGRESTALGCNWAFAPDRRHPPQLAQYRCRDAELRQRPTTRHREGDAVLRRHQRVIDRVCDQALSRRRRRRARSARGHELQHPWGRGVARDIRHRVPGDDRTRRAVDHGRPHRCAGIVAVAATRHP